mmetsp:Transcript_11209/g.45606  ORF Transcript_11209/g.45606 Transcript_11209/m.45606 type:complete len:423 (-) Transcript_11209:539-1807(-)
MVVLEVVVLRSVAGRVSNVDNELELARPRELAGSVECARDVLWNVTATVGLLRSDDRLDSRPLASGDEVLRDNRTLVAKVTVSDKGKARSELHAQQLILELLDPLLRLCEDAAHRSSAVEHDADVDRDIAHALPELLSLLPLLRLLLLARVLPLLPLLLALLLLLRHRQCSAATALAAARHLLLRLLLGLALNSLLLVVLALTRYSGIVTRGAGVARGCHLIEVIIVNVPGHELRDWVLGTARCICVEVKLLRITVSGGEVVVTAVIAAVRDRRRALLARLLRNTADVLRVPRCHLLLGLGRAGTTRRGRGCLLLARNDIGIGWSGGLGARAVLGLLLLHVSRGLHCRRSRRGADVGNVRACRLLRLLGGGGRRGRGDSGNRLLARVLLLAKTPRLLLLERVQLLLHLLHHGNQCRIGGVVG